MRSELPEFAQMCTDALDMRADAWDDELRRLADSATSEDVQVVRVQVDTRKWQMARAAPKRYGDRLDLNHSGKVEMARPPKDFSGFSHEEKIGFLDFMERSTGKREPA